MTSRASEPMRAGIAIGIVLFFLTLVAGAILMIIGFSELAPDILTKADAYTPGRTGGKGGDWIGTAIEYWPLYVLVLGFFGLVARAVFQSEVT